MTTPRLYCKKYKTNRSKCRKLATKGSDLCSYHLKQDGGNKIKTEKRLAQIIRRSVCYICMNSLYDVKRWNKCRVCSKGCHIRCKKFRSIINCPYCHRKDNTCCICFDDNNDKYPLPCGHWVHRKCVLKSRKPECPLCRKIVNDLQQAHRYRSTLISALEDIRQFSIYIDPQLLPQLTLVINAGVDILNNN